MAEGRLPVLVAEDDAEIRELIRARLGGVGLETRLARDGHEAVSALHGGRYSGLILDINLPHIDGFGVLEARRTVRTPPPVLMLTARHAMDDVTRAITLGARDYLTKPFSETQLLARVHRLIRPARAQGLQAVPAGGEPELV